MVSCCAVLYQLNCILWNCLSNRPINPFDCLLLMQAAYSSKACNNGGWGGGWRGGWGMWGGNLRSKKFSYRGVHSLWLEESKWSFVVPCCPLVTRRDHSSFSLSVFLEVCWCLMRFLFFISGLQMAFAGGWSSFVLGSISDCRSPPAPAVAHPPSEEDRPHQKSFW